MKPSYSSSTNGLRLKRMLRIVVGIGLLLLQPVVAYCADDGEADRADVDSPVDYARDIQPILANHCWNCHGPDEASRQADLRLDIREDAIAGGAIVPGDVEASSIIERILSTDEDQVMPPPSAKKPLSEEQKALLQTWIKSDAPFAGHWAFSVPQHRLSPLINNDSQIRNTIDAYVQHRLQLEGQQPAAEADRATLLRRVSLDLTGLPPSLRELDDFLSDTSPDAYEKVVDRLLASQHYAEMMAKQWLDLARYADTNGYNNDEDRTMWPWRDWVIRAFHENMPYDEFITQQLAGDLLPNPTEDQLIATGFLRNQGHNTEGGIIAEEYRVEYVADRVHTAATVFLGLSMQCARCHDHKYDPISQAEYYRFFALFNNLEERQASYSRFVAAEPFIRVPTAVQRERTTELDTQIADFQRQIEARKEQADSLAAEWLKTLDDEQLKQYFEARLAALISFDDAAESSAPVSGIQPQPVGTTESTEGRFGKGLSLSGSGHAVIPDVTGIEFNQPFTISVWIYPTQSGSMAILSKMDEGASYRGIDLLLENGKLVCHLIHHWSDNAIKVSTAETVKENQWQHVALVYDGQQKAAGVHLYLDGKATTTEVHADTLSGTLATDQPFRIGLRQKSLPYHGRIDELQILHREFNEQELATLIANESFVVDTASLRKPSNELMPAERELIRQVYLSQIDTDFTTWQQSLQAAEQELTKLRDEYPAVMIMKEMNPPRETFVLTRGQYDQPAEKVGPGIPQVLKSTNDSDPKNRLEFAHWLVNPENPLTARVAVNRFWEHYFGAGLVETVEDFGITGEFPSHLELLDHLALAFIESGWDMKAMQKMIVMSHTYRQDSRITAQSLAIDPANRLLGRGPRYRLSAETIRDNALAVAGLLARRIGGPSVKPYQPAGLWEDVTVERRGKYVADEGEGLFRRSMYTFWKRTCPPPTMVSFDAPNREVCVARRSRTNTPLQSLVLMNDPTYIEAARSLAQWVLRDGGEDDNVRIDYAYRRCLARSPRPDELPIVREALMDARQRFDQDPEAANQFNSVGTIPPDANLDAKELAAWTVVSSLLLNLDETISKR